MGFINHGKRESYAVLVCTFPIHNATAKDLSTTKSCVTPTSGKKKEKNKESNNAAAYSNEGKIQDIKAQSIESARNFCAGSFEGCPSRPSSPPLTVDRYRGAGHVSLR